MGSGRIEQDRRTEHVCVNEFERIENRAVHMTFGGKMDNRRKVLIGKQAPDQLPRGAMKAVIDFLTVSLVLNRIQVGAERCE